MTKTPARTKTDPAPLLLLLRINLLQAWRRLKSVREQSRLLVSFIVLFIVGYAGLSFWLFYKALRFMGAFPGLGLLLVERLLYLLFAFLFALLLLSNLVISYTNLFRNRETAFLLSLPVSAQSIFRWKFLESTALASWAFVFLIAPLLTAFGLTRQVPWHFYPLTVVLVGMFIVLPGVAGAWLAIQLARYLDRRTFQVAVLFVLLLLLGSVAFWWKAQPISDENLGTRVLPMLDQLLVKTSFAQFPFLPSCWLSRSVFEWTEGARAAAGFFMLVLLSYVLFFGVLAFTRLGSSFFDGVSAVQSRGSVWSQWEWFRNWRQRSGDFAHAGGPAEWLAGWLVWLDRDVRALLVKDARMFWRDTTQWGQAVMLFGLLGVYILNLRHFTHQLSNQFWVNLVSFLNLGACSLNLATVTTRFVYPQFSLEGQRLWIIGMAPMGLARVVKTKFWLGCCASLAVTLSLITLSCHLLNMTWDRQLFFGGVVTAMTFTLNGLAVGLGMLYPNLKETNPGKIVSGFGGTFCLVLSFLYILGSVLLLAFGSPGLYLRPISPYFSLASVAIFALLSAALGWLPLKLGLRQLKQFEF